jgi:hypothetical protein
MREDREGRSAWGERGGGERVEWAIIIKEGCRGRGRRRVK